MALSVRLRRLAYRAAYRALQVVWFVRRPGLRGVKCLITHQGRILLVRHTYGSRVWDLPGGKTKGREPALDAARREMEEELGLGGAPWREAGVLRGTDNFRHDVIHCFRAELPLADLRVDPVEIDAVEWFALDALPPELGRHVPVFLTRVIPATGAV